MLFHPLYKFVNVRYGFLGFFKLLLNMSNTLFEFGLLGGVFIYQPHANAFGNFARDLFFKRAFNQFIKLGNTFFVFM